MSKDAIVAQDPLERGVSRLFPKTAARLRKLHELRIKCANLEVRWHLFRMINFGTTGDELALMHFGLAMEYERLRYWWMRRIDPLSKLANKDVFNSTPGQKRLTP